MISAVRTFREALGITDCLGDLGVKKTDIPELARKAIRDPCLATNPKNLSVADIEHIYEKAF